MVFSSEQYYESKVFLKSYQDAQSALKEAAEYQANLKQYDYQQKRLEEIQQQKGVSFYPDTVKQGPNFKELKEVQLYKFSNNIFSKYFSGFDSFAPNDYTGFKNLLNNGIKKMQE